MSTEDAKTYLSKREIPRLFESLMTGLMFHRPTDHCQYLIDCLKLVQDKGTDRLAWNMFVEMKRAKTPHPLPPIGSRENSRHGPKRPISRDRSMTPKDEPKPLNSVRKSPLPPISREGSSTNFTESGSVTGAKEDRTRGVDLPEVPIVFLMGGPGSGKLTQAQRLVDRFEGWVHLSIGDLLRSQIADRGSAEEKWGMVGDLVSKGEMAPEDVTVDLLLSNLQKHKDAPGFLIEGYPRNMRQVREYDIHVGRVDTVFLLDCEENYCTLRLMKRGASTNRPDDNMNAVQKRLSFFKDNTLPVIKHYDEQGKVVIFDGDRDVEEIAFEMALVFHNIFFGKSTKFNMKKPSISSRKEKAERTRSPRSPKQTEPSAPPSEELPELPPLPAHLRPPEITVKDEGRKEGLPKAPIVFIGGGPGSGKGTQCKKIIERYPGFVHLSMGDILRTEISTKGSADDKWDMISTLLQKGEMAPQDVTIDLLLEALKKHSDATVFIIEGYPRDKSQLEEFNRHIGGLSFVLLLDCEEYYMQKRLMDRGKDTQRIDDNLNAISTRLTFFKNNTLPILKVLDDQGLLVPMNGDRDIDEIFFEICSVLDYAFYRKTEEEVAKPTEEVAKPTEEVAKPTEEEGAVSKEPVKEEVIEEAVTKESENVTGGDAGNPSHTAALDAAAAAAESKSDAPAEGTEGN